MAAESEEPAATGGPGAIALPLACAGAAQRPAAQNWTTWAESSRLDDFNL